MQNARRFYKYRTTTEHLDRDINRVVDDGDEFISAHFQGGRDWLLICRQGESVAPERLGDNIPSSRPARKAW